MAFLLGYFDFLTPRKKQGYSLMLYDDNISSNPSQNLYSPDTAERWKNLQHRYFKSGLIALLGGAAAYAGAALTFGLSAPAWLLLGIPLFVAGSFAALRYGALFFKRLYHLSEKPHIKFLLPDGFQNKKEDIHAALEKIPASALKTILNCGATIQIDDFIDNGKPTKTIINLPFLKVFWNIKAAGVCWPDLSRIFMFRHKRKDWNDQQNQTLTTRFNDSFEDVLLHEFGHAYDFALGWKSISRAFFKAFTNDKKQFLRNCQKNKEKMTHYKGRGPQLMWQNSYYLASPIETFAQLSSIKWRLMAKPRTDWTEEELCDYEFLLNMPETSALIDSYMATSLESTPAKHAPKNPSLQMNETTKFFGRPKPA